MRFQHFFKSNNAFYLHHNTHHIFLPLHVEFILLLYLKNIDIIQHHVRSIRHFPWNHRYINWFSGEYSSRMMLFFASSSVWNHLIVHIVLLSPCGDREKNSPTVAHACCKRWLKWVLGAWGYNWATQSPGDINMETWSSRLRVGAQG
jgi:hypothetical protein